MINNFYKKYVWKILKFFQRVYFYSKEIVYKTLNYNFDYKKTFKNYKISFCTTCKGRTYDLKKTYLKNIKSVSTYPNCEFILVDYNSKDDLSSWVKKKLSRYIKEGKVIFVQNFDFEKFHMAQAKNISHRFASGDILVNLDADNYLGEGFAEYINEIFNKYNNVVITTSTSNGANGRIAMLKKHFYGVRGYNEIFASAYEESDLIFRIKKKYKVFEYFIKHKKFLNFEENFYEKKAPKNYSSQNIKITLIREHEKKIFLKNKKKSISFVNSKGFGKGNFLVNFEFEKKY